MASKPWTIAELNKAIQLHEQGLTASEIGETLNRSKGGVISVFKVNGIEMKRGRPKADDRLLELDRSIAKQAYVGSQKLLAALQVAGVRP
jgi:orotate phosphoribosyltransferase-like protein